MADESPPDGLPSLTDAEIKAITGRLKQGKFLDDHYRRLLFRQPKEYELTYAGKQSRSQILADTMEIPLQTLKSFGGETDGWTNKLVFGDNLQVLKTLLEAKERGDLTNSDGSPGVRLCYIDPPFATKREFRTSKGNLAYRDKVEGAEFIEFLRKRLIFIHELLSDDGVLYLHLDTNKVHYMKILLDEIFGPDCFRNEIIWKRSDAHSDARGQGATDFGRIHDSILRYTKGVQAPFDPQFLPLPDSTAERWYRHVEEGTGRRYNKADITGPGGAAKGNPRYEIFGVTRYWRYSKERMERLIAEGLVRQDKPGTVPYRKRYLDESAGVPLQDIWTDIPMLRGYAGNGERTGFPTQKPEALVERIIKSSSAEGDLVLDCFVGAGTTAVAAERLGRRWIAVDCGKLAIYTAQRRLISMTDGSSKQKSLSSGDSFELCTAGLYDNELLEKLPFERYEEFALQLFGGRARHHKIASVPMVGTRKGCPVHLFPFKEVDALMGRSYVESLHGRIKNKVTGAVYVITPVAACDPGLFEDVIHLDENVYFVLRIPYSVIEALHGRDFELLTQPSSFDELNDAIDSFGFDFVEPPEVEVSYRRSKGKLRAEIKSFHRGGLDPDEFGDLEDKGRGDLAMVMLDADHNDKVFRLTEHRFADELEQSEWTFEVEGSGKAMIIYMDTHGNERREVVELAKAPTKRKPAKGKAAQKKSGTGKRKKAKAPA